MHIINPEFNSAMRAAAIQKKLDSDVHERHLAERLIESLLSHQSTLNTLEKADLVTALLSQTNSAEERASVKRKAVDILLQEDNADMCAAFFPEQSLNGWVIDNAELAFNSCPKTVQSWKAGGCFGSTLILNRTASSVEHESESEKLKILSGHTNNRLHQIILFVLSENPDAWNTLSPSWIGVEGGSLRKKAIGLGWEPRRLTEMTFFSIWSSPEHWLKNVRYPYSIAVCKWITDVLRNNGLLAEGPDGYFDTTLTMSASACPRDATLAQMLLAHSPVGVGYQLVRHSSITILDDNFVRMIAAVVQLQATVHGMESLTRHVCEGTLLPENIETFDINELV